MAQVHAVVDLANAVALRSPILALESSAALCLLNRSSFPDLAPVGPWLVDLAQCRNVADALRGPGRGKAWGYLIHCERDLAALRNHLRKFNLVRVAGRDAPVLFRYFDPVVLHHFLTSVLTPPQIASFCEGVSAFEIEAGRTGRIEMLRPEALIRQVRMSALPV